MQFRCYSCSFVFHDGPPPLEALSDQQMGLVQGPRTEVEEVRLILLGTVFSGLGAANFCDPCLLAIVDNPGAFREGEDFHNLEQTPEAIWCTCGMTLWTSKGPRSFKTRDYYSRGPNWVEVNRLMMRHRSDG